jgi:hypothetical protein
MINETILKNVLESLQIQRKFWCAECVDDPEDMMNGLPDLFTRLVSEMEEALGLPCSVLRITSAMYGAKGRFKDVTDIIENNVVEDHLEMRVDNSTLGGDPAPGVVKTLEIYYNYNGIKNCVSAREQQMIRINSEPF